MKWTLTYGGVTTGTSERMLQSNWNLFEREGGAALAKIDFAKVPKGVCLNQRADGPRARRHRASEQSADAVGGA